MLELPSRGSLATIADAVSSIGKVPAFGLIRQTDDGRTSFVCCTRNAVAEYRLAANQSSELLYPNATDPQHLSVDDLQASAGGDVGECLRAAGVGQLLSIGLPDFAAPSRFWIGVSASARPAIDQPRKLEELGPTVAGILEAAPSQEEAAAQLGRLERAAMLLPALLAAADTSALFEGLSSICSAVLPHDRIALGLSAEETASLSGSRGTRVDVGSAPVVVQQLADAIARTWEFEIVNDRALDLDGRNPPPEAAGMRSSLSVPLRSGHHAIGSVTFLAAATHSFAGRDVAVARRLADLLAVALTHRRLAEDSRRNASLRERAANLEVLDGLLATLTGVLDVREVFDRVSAIAQKVLPHDALSIAEVIDNGAGVRIHASHGLGNLPEPFDIPTPDPTLVTEHWDFRLIDDVHDRPEYARGPGIAAGMRSMLFVPIRFEGKLFGGLNFYSRTPGRYLQDDVLVGRRITDHVALALSHRRLAEEAKRNEELRAHATNLELLDDLLGALIDSGSLPDVFGRVSAIAAKVLPHDAAALVVRLPDGRRGRVYASSGFVPELPEIIDLPEDLLQNPNWEHHIFDNLSVRSEPRYVRLTERGFRSLLRVPIRLEGQFAGVLIFVSTKPSTFKQPDVLVARRIADRLALTLAHDRQLETAKRADEANERAARLEARVRALTDELDSRTGYRRVVGESPQWRQVLTQATQVAATETTVLLLGESGTGKEVVARFLHRGSPRSRGPFVALNCAALPEQLLEAELFGYERGAYTGATQSKPGQLEQAAGGTLFLDEVAEMSPSAQAKFLRVLQEREFQRLGGTRVLRTDARVVAATNRDLPRGIASGQFREDLYYRLNVFAIRLPPLRDRRDDILPLSEAFLAEIGRGLGRPPGGLSRDARQMLIAYHWPGNVRELRNILERAAILCDGGLIVAEHLALTVSPTAIQAPAPAVRPAIAADAPEKPIAAPASTVPASPTGDLHSMERTMIEQALQNARFNKSKAAKALGLTRRQLYIRMKRHGFD